MDNASQKQANSTTIKSTISCALQVSWVPVVCYAQHVEWSGLPIERALPLACYFSAVLFAAACVMHFMKETLKSDSGHVLDIGAIATYAFGIALLLATEQSEGNAPISCIAFALIGCSRGIGVLQLERCLMCLEPKQTTFATLAAVFVACAAILVLPIFFGANHPYLIPRLRCSVLPCEASLGTPQNRPFDHRFKAPSREN